MTAQQQLATLLAAPDEAHALFGDAALKFLRDHGSAIAELIEAVADRRRTESAWLDYEVTGESPVPYDPKEGVRLENLRDAAIDRETAALRKLTQDATT
jgi:hypothetical protein